jgi:outer membrane protein assembly factor BamE
MTPAAFSARAALLAACATLAACSTVGDATRNFASRLSPYQVEVVQGNFVSREQRQYLRPGMTRAQVRDVLGTPLVTSLFHADRWDYAFTIRRMGVPAQQFRLTLQFRNDLLSSIEGDELPSEAEFVQRLSRPAPAANVPALEASEEQLNKFPARKTEPAKPLPSVPLPATYPPLESAPR